MSETATIELPLSRGRSLAVAIDLPATSDPRPAVLICHGFKGFMDWGFFPYLADLLAARGYVAVRFNFSGSGMGPGDELVTDTQAFATATHSKDLEETIRMIEALGTDIAPDRIDRDRIGLIGHSRGGGTAVLAAGDSTVSLRSLVTWSAVSSFDRLTADERSTWRRSGELPIVNARTGQELALDPIVADDLRDNRARLDILAAAGRCTAPWLIVHGEQDETVPVAEARQLEQAAGDRARLEVIEGGTHTFGASHPFHGPSPQLIGALNLTQRWLRQTLGS